MGADKPRLVSLRVSEDDYAKLAGQAGALGLKPAVLARVLLRTSLNSSASSSRHSLAEFHEALAALDALVPADGLPIDGVEEIRRVREERDAQQAELLGYAPPG